VVAVSSVTGSGLDELRMRLLEMARETPLKDSSRHFRLPIDRVFSMRGFGTGGHGTLISGSIEKEREWKRIRAGDVCGCAAIQVTWTSGWKRALAGQRTALNVTGAEPDELARA